MSFLNKVSLDYRPKAYIQSNKFTGQYIHNTEAFLVPSYSLLTLSYYIEGEYTKANLTSLNSAITTFMNNNDISLTNITTNISAGSTDGSILIRHDKLDSIDSNSAAARSISTNLSNLKDLLVSDQLTISYLDILGNTINSTADSGLNNDGFANDIFRYNTLYQFQPDTTLFSNQYIKFENATSSSNVIKSGDKVWIKNSNNQYLCADLSEDRKSYVNGTIYFKDQSNKYSRMLFEIHGFYTDDMSDANAVAQERYIPDDYGFKIEILPPHINSLFTGLSDFAGEDYNFTADSTWIFQDALDVNRFNTSVYYAQALGETTNDPNIDDVEFNIDEVWLTYDGSSFGFDFDNDSIATKVFFEGKVRS